MDCQFTEKISLLVDGELSEKEAAETEAHLKTCPDCRLLKNDFLFFRREIKDSMREAFTGAENIGLNPKAKQKSLWQRQISFPVPVFALVLIALTAFGIWRVSFRSNQNSNPPKAENSTETIRGEKEAMQQNEFSLARFDAGGRAEIYTVKRTTASRENKQTGGVAK
jgi:hypothetical protein